jgi:hypothetical protein
MKRETVVGVKHGRSRWQGGGRSQIPDLRSQISNGIEAPLGSEI